MWITNILFQNNRFLTRSEGKTVDEMIKKETIRGEMKKVSFEGLFTIFQESKPIYHPLLLRQLFVKGHMSLILTILWKLHSLLESDENTSKVPAFLDFSLENILSEINLDKSEKVLDNTKRHKDTALGLFEKSIYMGWCSYFDFW